jgi:hypothetical protein
LEFTGRLECGLVLGRGFLFFQESVIMNESMEWKSGVVEVAFFGILLFIIFCINTRCMEGGGKGVFSEELRVKFFLRESFYEL